MIKLIAQILTISGRILFIGGSTPLANPAPVVLLQNNGWTIT